MLPASRDASQRPTPTPVKPVRRTSSPRVWWLTPWTISRALRTHRTNRDDPLDCPAQAKPRTPPRLGTWTDAGVSDAALPRGHSGPTTERRSAVRYVGAPERGAQVATTVCRDGETTRHRGGFVNLGCQPYWQYRAVWCRIASRPRDQGKARFWSFALNGKRTQRIRASGLRLGWLKRWEPRCAR